MTSERITHLAAARKWSILAVCQAGLTLVQIGLAFVPVSDFRDHVAWLLIGALGTGALAVYSIMQCRRESRASDEADAPRLGRGWDKVK